MTSLFDLFRRKRRSGPRTHVPFPDDTTVRQRQAKDLDPDQKVIGFYTRDSFYEQEARRMAASARRLGLAVTTTPVDSAGSWVRNASLKATFLQQQRLEQRGPLLYVDVDAVFHDNPWPRLAAHDGDISVFYSPNTHYLIAATILINDTPAAQVLMDRWKERCNADPEIWDQVVLQQILAEDAATANPQFQVRRLPTSFCWIFDSDFDLGGGGVVVEQLQASREAKNTRFLVPKKRLRLRRERIREIETILFPRSA